MHFIEHEEEYRNPNGEGGYDDYKCRSCEAKNRQTHRNDKVFTNSHFRHLGEHVYDTHQKP